VGVFNGVQVSDARQHLGVSLRPSSARPPQPQPPFAPRSLNQPQVKARLGGRVRLIVSGGAPLAPHVEEFLRVAMCAPVAQVGVVQCGAVWGRSGCLCGCRWVRLEVTRSPVTPYPVQSFARSPQPHPTPPHLTYPPPSPQPQPHPTRSLKTPHPQGYGLTECCAGASIALADNHAQFATNGPPLPCIEICFESVPGACCACFVLRCAVSLSSGYTKASWVLTTHSQSPPSLTPPTPTQPNPTPERHHTAEMNYDASDPAKPAGEVLLRGPCLFDGYYKQPDKTEEVGGQGLGGAWRCVGVGWGVG